MQTLATTHAHPWEKLNEASALRTLNTFAVDLIGIPSAEDLFWYVAQNVVGRLNFVDCVVYQVNKEQTELKQVAAWGDKNPFGRSIINPLVIPFGHGITGQVAQLGEAIVIDDLLQDQNYIPDTNVARSEICVPVMVQGRVVGVIDSEHPDEHAFGEAELEILSTVAAMTGAKLELLAEAERSTQRYQDLVASHARLTEEITARKALETKLFEVRKLEALGRVSGRFAHEFNNILAVILGNLELLEITTDMSETPALLEDAMISARRGARLMRDMLVFAQKSRLSPVILDLNEVVSGFCKTHAAGPTRHVTLSLSPDLWPIRADAAALESILLNIVENACDAVCDGGEIAILTENIVHMMGGVRPANAEMLPGRYTRLRIVDTGLGIPADRMSQIFDPFFTSKPQGDGTGLGLSIVRGLAQQSGGAVTITSEPAKGTTVDIYLPAWGGKETIR